MPTVIDNAFPLINVALPKVNALQKESTSYVSSKNSQDLVILDAVGIEPEPNAFWEGGMFIDLYI